MSNAPLEPDLWTDAGERPAGGHFTPLAYRLVIYAVLAILVGLLIYYGRPAVLSLGATRPPLELVVYGFSTQEEVFRQQIFPAFEVDWEARHGRAVHVQGVFGPSGTLAEQVILGAPADVAIFSNAQHVNWLRAARLVKPDTQANLIGSTPMVIVTRPGNPAGIHNFADLSRPGLRLIHPEPGQSGAGDWAVLAEYGSAYLVDGNRETAAAQLQAIWDNVDVLSTSARAALTLFELGAGDALVTYEQDALLALDRGVALEVIVPPHTIIAQHAVVIVDRNVSYTERTAAEAFVAYLLGAEGQAILASYHMRPPEAGVGADGTEFTAFTVDDLGGWSRAYQDLVEGLWRSEVAPQLDDRRLPVLHNGDD